MEQVIMLKEKLEKIRKSEAQAAAIIGDAGKQAKRIIEQAHSDAAEVFRHAMAQTDAAVKSLEDEAEAEAGAKIAELNNRNDQAVEAVRAAGSVKIKAAVDMLMRRMTKGLVD